MLVVPDYDPYNPIPLDVNEGLERYLEFESSIALNEDHNKSKLNLALRFRAMLVIFKYSKHEYFDPLVPYLALSYFDRFFARGNSLPSVMSSDDHNVELMAICCLTLAWKMRKGNFKFSKLKADKPELEILKVEKFMAMESNILDGLNCDLRVVTALCFVPYFVPKFGSTDGFSYRTINEIIINSQESNLVKKQKPSVIAALALLIASSHLYPQQFHSFRDQIISEGIIREEHVKDCMDHMIKLCRSSKLIFETNKPRRLVQAEVKCEQRGDETTEQVGGETYEQHNTEKSQEDAATKSTQEVNETSKQSTAEETKEDTADVSEQDPAENSFQIADEESKRDAAGKTKQGAEDPSSKQLTGEKSGVLDTNLQREADKGKKKVGETASEIAQMAEEKEDRNFNFSLRWPMGEVYGKTMTIFRSDSDSGSTLKTSEKEKNEPEPVQSEDDSSINLEAIQASMRAQSREDIEARMRASSRDRVLDWLMFDAS
ncbi:uncharacterized protein LOC133785523 [Humulus lupulus]|uniref:uncharacterized protein LOC133785523 n=1 Tax=Humulus lupulus TaxID=3486 RepID=UPI002B414E97|nr:uncharacterized protein LOC133785523 [Humulus lupulus]